MTGYQGEGKLGRYKRLGKEGQVKSIEILGSHPIHPHIIHKSKMVRLRDGMWLPANGVRTEYAEDIYDITSAPDQQGVSLLCPVKQVHTRGNTLNTPTVTIVSC